MDSKRRLSRSYVAVNAAAEILEFRRVLSASGTADVVVNAAAELASGTVAQNNVAQDNGVEVDSRLQAWRQEVRASVVEQADALYANQFGQTIDSPIHWWRGIAVAEDFLFQAAESVSDTNVQVAGVDEGDLVETDGTYIYTISGQEIIIIAAATDQQSATVLSRLELTETPIAMLLHNDRLTVVSQPSAGLPWLADSTFMSSYRTRTIVTVLDVSDRQNPLLSHETIIDGQYLASRAIADQVYVTVNNSEGIPYVPELETVFDESLETRFRYETREEYLQRVDRLIHGDETFGGWMPPSVYRRGDSDSEQPLESLGWLQDVPSPTPDGGQLTTVLQFDTASTDATPVSHVSINTPRYSKTQVYASQTAVYVISEEYLSGEVTDPLPIGDLLPQPSTVQSVIHQIGISTGQLVLEARGVVPGNVESQFSLDEYNGYLRVATTTGNNWWWTDQTSANHLFVLQRVDDQLVQVGSVGDLAPGERIYAARFDGDRGWMVTFRQVDPVYSLDLSDPENPIVTGELKIPGYSDYLQQIDENHLLAIGRNADEDGVVQEVQVSLFDVSQMEQPELLHRYSLSPEFWGTSEALQDHLAFHYLTDSQMLAIPFGAWGQQGMVLLRVDVETGFELAGNIVNGPPVSSPENLLPVWGQDNSYRRSVQIDDLLYAVSASTISVVDLQNPDAVIARVQLQEEGVPVSVVTELPTVSGLFGDIVRGLEVLNSDGTVTDMRLRLQGLLDRVLPDLQSVVEYEFLVKDATSGVEVLRTRTSEPELQLRDQLDEVLAGGTYTVQYRTRSARLLNSSFGAWSDPETVSIGAATAQVISDTVLGQHNHRLQWSRVADQLRQVVEGTESTANAVQRYEVWINDAVTNQRVLLNRWLDLPELDVNLAAGDYFAWVRAVYEDGTQGDWSERQRFSVLAEELQNVISSRITGSTTPQISWATIAGAVSFELEVTTPNGTVTVYSAADLPAAPHQIATSLTPGEYVVRVRGNLGDGQQTDWSRPASLTIADRPTAQLRDSALELLAPHAESLEVWVSNVASGERVFHHDNLQNISITDAVQAFGLSEAAVGQYNIWVRSLLPDGTRSAWSPKVDLNIGVADLVSVLPVTEIPLGGDQTLAWNAATGVEAYEVFVRPVGAAAALYRQAGIRELSHNIAEQLEPGRYDYWVRGILTGGGFTDWGLRHNFTVSDQPVVSIVDGVATWLNNVDDNRYEVWINRVDEELRVVQGRVVHLEEFVGNSFDLNTLPEGNYSVWVRTVRDDGGDLLRSAWSERQNLSVSQINDALDQLSDTIDQTIDDVIDDVLDSINLF